VAPPALTHADLLATLVAQGFLAIVQGKAPAKMPVEAVPLSEEEKAKVHAAKDALVVFYPVGDTGVFLQLGKSRGVVWYDGVNCDGALKTFERALKAAFPRHTFVRETPYAESPGANVRIYRVDTDAKHYVDLEVMHPANKKARQQFMVRMTAWEKTQ
jgi:hypothetical protein